MSIHEHTAKAYDGTLEVGSEGGHGSTLRVLLPEEMEIVRPLQNGRQRDGGRWLE